MTIGESERGNAGQVEPLEVERVAAKPLAALAQVWTVLIKDLHLEWRRRSRTGSIASFALTVLLLLSFASGPSAVRLADQAGAYLWLGILLASTLAFADSFRVEVEDDALTNLRMVPLSAAALYWGKALLNALVLFVLSLALLPVAFVLFEMRVLGSWPILLFSLILGTLALSGPGTLYSAMTAHSRGRDVLLPLLLFPLIVPALVAAVTSTSLALNGDPMNQASSWISLLVVFNLIYWSLCPLLFQWIIEE